MPVPQGNLWYPRVVNEKIAYSNDLWNKAAAVLEGYPSIVSGVVYTEESNLPSLLSSNKPTLRHIVGSKRSSKQPETVEYIYPSVSSSNFVAPNHPHFHYNTESVAHTRTLQFLKPKMDGPWFDLETIWDEHTYYEFADRSVEHTMSTMVQEPYVNHVPTVSMIYEEV